MANIGDMMMDFRMHVPGMPEPFVRRLLSIALDEFLTRSEVWSEDWAQRSGEGVTWDSTSQEVAFDEFDWAAPNSTINPGGDVNKAWLRVAKVRNLYYKPAGSNACLVPYINRERLSSLDPNYQATLGTSPNGWYHSRNLDVPRIGIYPRVAVSQVGVLFPSLVYSIKRQDTYLTSTYDTAAVSTATALSYPDFIYLGYGQAVVSGALARAMLMPGRDWSNPQLAAAHGAMFEDGIAKAKSHADAGFTNHTQRVMSYGGY